MLELDYNTRLALTKDVFNTLGELRQKGDHLHISSWPLSMTIDVNGSFDVGEFMQLLLPKIGKTLSMAVEAKRYRESWNVPNGNKSE